jgi:hypothetical protein
MATKYSPWSDSDIEQLKTLVASGASAVRASVALKRTLAVTKNKARDIGVPFRPEAEMRRERQKIFQNSPDRRPIRGRFPERE